MNTILLWHWVTLLSPYVAGTGVVAYLAKHLKPWLDKRISAAVALAKKDVPAVVKEVEKAAPVATEVIGWAERLLKLPWVATIVGKDKLQVSHIEKVLRLTKIEGIAAKAYAAFSKEFGVLANMNSIQQGALMDTIKAEAAKVGLTLTTQEQTDIVSIVHEIASGVESIAKTVVPQVKQTSDTVAALNAPPAAPATPPAS